MDDIPICFLTNLLLSKLDIIFVFHNNNNIAFFPKQVGVG